MTKTAQFDILKRTSDGAYFWLEAVHDLEEARNRLLELCIGNVDEYFVFDQKTQEVVAAHPNPPSLLAFP
jgi:hypothetical protein